jgi:large subunit ribosomal protein L19
MHYFHFNRREKPKPKFKSPRKRASKLLAELNDEAVSKSKEANPDVWSARVQVGDAIEITSVNQGGVDSADVEKLRGVVLGKTHRGLATSVIIRDVVMGTPIERKVCLHSPLIKSVEVLEENFVYKGKRKVKRAKLYFMRDRKPEDTRVSKW